MGVQEGCGGDDGGSAVEKKGGSSTMDIPLPEKKNNKIYGQFFSISQFKLSTSRILLQELTS